MLATDIATTIAVLEVLPATPQVEALIQHFCTKLELAVEDGYQYNRALNVAREWLAEEVDDGCLSHLDQYGQEIDPPIFDEVGWVEDEDLPF